MRVLIITFFVVILDQVTKLYIKGIKIPFLGIDTPGMPYQSSKKVIGDFFKITFIENPGMAFGLQFGGKLFLSLFTIFATLILLLFLYKNRNEGIILRLALAFILGGAIGNLIDRVFYGAIYDYAPIFYGRVVDFLHFDFPNFTIFGKNIYSWPIFNFADVFVTVGFLIILFGYKKIFVQETPVTEPDIDGESLSIQDLNPENSGTGNLNSYKENLVNYGEENIISEELPQEFPYNSERLSVDNSNDTAENKNPDDRIKFNQPDDNSKTGI